MSSFKIIVVGDSSVGKTSIINRFCSQTFTHSMTSTIGVDYKLK
jgi:GTPase SAR1 family protein